MLILLSYTMAANCAPGALATTMRGAAISWWPAACGIKAEAKSAIYDCFIWGQNLICLFFNIKISQRLRCECSCAIYSAI